MSLPAGFTGWSIKCLTGVNAGVEKSLAAWGVKGAVINRRPTAMETMTCSSIVADATQQVFFYGDVAALYYTAADGTRTRWFHGVWTKPMADLSGSNESIEYELSGSPWWYLTRTPMLIPSLAVTTLSPTAPIAVMTPLVTMGGTVTEISSSLQGALELCVTCGAEQSTGAVVPFVIGTISVNAMFIPAEQVANVTAAQFIEHLLRWSPDCAVTVDYAEPTPGAPPTVNVLARSNAPAVNLPMTGGVMDEVSKITPRNDLVVKGVVIAYQTTTTIGGQNYVSQNLDTWPAGTLPTDFGVMVSIVDLSGGSETFQFQDVATVTLPQAGASSSGSGVDPLPWFKKHCEWMFGTASAPSALDTANITVQSVLGIDLWGQDPYETGPAPTGFTVGQMINELVGGAITKWMTDDLDLWGAYVILSFQMKYTGSDQNTLSYFTKDPTSGNYYRTEYVHVKATNAATETYSHVASETFGEGEPTGLAQAAYLARCQLHFQGSLRLTEKECSGLVQMKNVVNLTGGAAAWATMAAQITSITESLEEGTTTVQFGPPIVLGVDELVDLWRCTRIRQAPYNADQASSGQASTNNIIGHTHSPHSSTSSMPGGGASVPPQPWGLLFRTDPSNPANWQFQVYSKSVLSDINGVPIMVPGVDGSTWSACSSADTMVCLCGAVSDLGNTGVTVFIGAPGSAFDPSVADGASNARIQNDGATPPNQTKWYLQIDTITWSGGSPTAFNCVNKNLALSNTTSEGMAAIYPQ